LPKSLRLVPRHSSPPVAVAIDAPRAERIAHFIADNPGLETPFVVIDLQTVADRYCQLASALPMADIFYAIKANPAPEILRLLVKLGSKFDVASPNEVDMCLAAGADPSTISYGNTIKKQRDIQYAYDRGVRLFAFDCDAELDKIVECAPDATVFCRITTDGGGADWPLSRKFGTTPALASELLVVAAAKGLSVGVSFHVGSQQRDLQAWDKALAPVAAVFERLRAEGVKPVLVNLGGGFPGHYIDGIPAVESYGGAIIDALQRHLGPDLPRIVAEPGRYLVADAGVMETEVVLVSRRTVEDDVRWVYLDAGIYNGLAEAQGEAIKYRIETDYDGGPTGRVALAGPTCDSTDVIYECTHYELPLALTAGDRIRLLSTGAYTTTYASVAFNGFEPLRSHYLPADG
jgi:ornithine decarboxylase